MSVAAAFDVGLFIDGSSCRKEKLYPAWSVLKYSRQQGRINDSGGGHTNVRRGPFLVREARIFLSFPKKVDDLFYSSLRLSVH